MMMHRHRLIGRAGTGLLLGGRVERLTRLLWRWVFFHADHKQVIGSNRGLHLSYDIAVIVLNLLPDRRVDVRFVENIA
jgi:hypothetical protein